MVARPVGAVARLARACRRRPLVALLFALLAISVFGGLGGVTWKWLEANNATTTRRTPRSRRPCTRRTGPAWPPPSAALQNHDVADAARHLESAPEALRGWEWRHLHSRLDDSSAVIPLPDGGGFLIAAPDRLRIGTWTSDGLRLTDLEGGDHGTVPIQPRSRAYTFSRHADPPGPSGRGVGGEHGLRPARRGRSGALSRPAGGRRPGPVVVSPDGTRLACVTGSRASWARVAVFDATSGEADGGLRWPPQAIWDHRLQSGRHAARLGR